MPRNEVDPSLITNEPRKRKMASYVTNADNISEDKDETVKRLKCTVDPCGLLIPKFLNTLTNPLIDVATSRKSPTVEDVEDEEMRPRGNVPPKNPDVILELSDDAAACPSVLKKVPKPSTTAKPKARFQFSQSTVDDVEDDEDSDTYTHGDKKKIHTTANDSDIEEIENPKESPEEELGELSNGTDRQSLTYILKNEWQKNGHRPFMVFSKHVLQSKLLVVDVAMSSSVPHHTAKERV